MCSRGCVLIIPTPVASSFMLCPDQLKRYLEEHAGAGIHYVWIDVSCINVRGLGMKTLSAVMYISRRPSDE